MIALGTVASHSQQPELVDCAVALGRVVEHAQGQLWVVEKVLAKLGRHKLDFVAEDSDAQQGVGQRLWVDGQKVVAEISGKV